MLQTLKIGILLLFAFVAAAAAHAETSASSAQWVGDKACVLADHPDSNPENVLRRLDEFDCSETAFARPMGHIWISFNTSELPVTMEDPALRFSLSYNRDITMTLLDRTGAVTTRIYTPAELAKLADVPSKIVLPFQASGPQKTETILIGIAGVWDISNWKGVDLVSQAVAEQQNLQRTMLFGLLTGILLTPLLLCAVVYPVLRSSFLPYHFGMLFCALVNGLSWTGMVNAFPVTVEPITRSVINHLSIALAFMFACLLTRELVGRRILGRFYSRLLTLTGIIPVLITITLMTVAPAFSHYGSLIYYGMFLVPLGAIICTLLVFSVQGVRICQLQLLAWSPMILFVIGRIGRGTGLFENVPLMDVALFPSLVTEGLLTTSVVAYRIYQLRQERDYALRQQATLEDLATQDALTGALNRRAFIDRFNQIRVSGIARHKVLTLILLDIDHFKRVNDEHGHATGDEVLVQITRLLKDQCRGEDICARFGGEEFAVLMETSSMAAADACAERLRQAIADFGFGAVGQVTVSLGFVQVTEDPNTPFNSWYEAADAALYAAKSKGRNRVQRSGWSPEGAPGSDSETYAAGWKVV